MRSHSKSKSLLIALLVSVLTGGTAYAIYLGCASRSSSQGNTKAAPANNSVPPVNGTCPTGYALLKDGSACVQVQSPQPSTSPPPGSAPSQPPGNELNF